jgi:hypothetical protein
MKEPEAYSLEYVEDFFGPRTTQMVADRSLQSIGQSRTGSQSGFSALTAESPVWYLSWVGADIRGIAAWTLSMADNNALYAIRFPDGSVSLYIDEDYAIERGVDPAILTRVEIPRDMFVSGTIQEIREYVALYLESRHSGTA